ncbi:Protein N-acetyltransferase, RimJ/RimL family [Agrococcus baldri]|uniref:Protein N-acetyltransferase, RimJ/RimL family n=1 Tax=Agrococcus baldri TaxID=153730 RepID=A0AA94L089_9MICO|nr:GNAT family N-acetyltransferase [Agrococcus baldri]SFS16520.1 Protein N-acetyltransferase, RimJ/RimL family [Agrococcus baldri]
MTVDPIEPAEAMRVARAALPIRTDRLVLRTLRPDDLDAVRAYRNAPGQRRWTYNRDQTEAELMAWTAGDAPVFLRDGDAMQLGIELDGRLVGDLMVRITSLASRQAELGWTVAAEAQGKGVATEAAQAALELAFALGAHRVSAQLDEQNVASRRVAERIGMAVEGRFVEDEVNPATGELGTSLYLAARRTG